MGDANLLEQALSAESMPFLRTHDFVIEEESDIEEEDIKAQTSPSEAPPGSNKQNSSIADLLSQASQGQAQPQNQGKKKHKNNNNRQEQNDNGGGQKQGGEKNQPSKQQEKPKSNVPSDKPPSLQKQDGQNRRESDRVTEEDETRNKPAPEKDSREPEADVPSVGKQEEKQEQNRGSRTADERRSESKTEAAPKLKAFSAEKRTEEQEKKPSPALSTMGIDVADDDGRTFPLEEVCEVTGLTENEVQSVLNTYPSWLSYCAWGTPPMFTLSDMKNIEDAVKQGLMPSNVVSRDESSYSEDSQTYQNVPQDVPRKTTQEAREEAYSYLEPVSMPETEKRSYEDPKALQEALDEINTAFAEKIESALSASLKSYEEKLTELGNSISSLKGEISRLKSSEGSSNNNNAITDRLNGIQNRLDRNTQSTQELLDGIAKELKSTHNGLSQADREALSKLSKADLSAVLNSLRENGSKTDRILTMFEKLNTILSSAAKDEGEDDVQDRTNEILDAIEELKGSVAADPPASHVTQTPDEVMDYLERILEAVSIDPTATSEYLEVSSKLQDSLAVTEKYKTTIRNIAKELDDSKHFIVSLKQEIAYLNEQNAALNERLRQNTIKEASPASRQEDEEEFDDFYDEDEADSLNISTKKNRMSGLFGKNR